MPGKAAVKKDNGEAYELVDLAIGRVDGVDDPAHGRQFLLLKSANSAVAEKDEETDDDAVEADAIATAAEKCLVAMSGEQTPLTDVQVQALKSLAGALGIDDDEISVVPVPVVTAEIKAKPARARKSKSKADKQEPEPEKAKQKGGRMAGNGKKVRKANEVEAEEVDPTDDELEEMVDAINEGDEEEEETDETTAGAGDDSDDDDDDDEDEEEVVQPKAKQPVLAARGGGGTNAKNFGPKVKLPTKPHGKVKVPTKASTRKSADDDNFDERIAAAVATAMAGPLEALTAAISGLQPTQKSAARPVSKQAKGQDDVQKSSGAIPKIGEGLWTNVIFPE